VIEFNEIEGFEWDRFNIIKIWQKYGVNFKECEEIFFNTPLMISDDTMHSTFSEKRFHVLGQTNRRRKLFLFFNMRSNKIRVISARDMNKKERKYYIEKEN
jgi:hypothetical protein